MKKHYTKRKQKHLTGVESSPQWGRQARLCSWLCWELAGDGAPCPHLVTSAALTLCFQTTHLYEGVTPEGDTTELPSDRGSRLPVIRKHKKGQCCWGPFSDGEQAGNGLGCPWTCPAPCWDEAGPSAQLASLPGVLEP